MYHAVQPWRTAVGSGANGMKFVYVDETGDKGQSDVFVMTGLLIDAYSLRKYTATFDGMIAAFLARHPKSPRELKAKEFINGSGDWSKVNAGERKKFLDEICDLAVECATVYAIAFSFQNFEKAIDVGYVALMASTRKSWLHFRSSPVDFCGSRLAIGAASERARALAMPAGTRAQALQTRANSSGVVPASSRIECGFLLGRLDRQTRVVN